MDNPEDNKLNKSISGFWRSFIDIPVSFKQHWVRFHCQGEYPERIPKEA